jgi:hypothetical protein
MWMYLNFLLYMWLYPPLLSLILIQSRHVVTQISPWRKGNTLCTEYFIVGEGYGVLQLSRVYIVPKYVGSRQNNESVGVP